MIVTFDITKVTIVIGRGADMVFLHTTEDSPCPGVTKESLGLDFAVAAGKGYRYVTEVLKIDEEFVEVINA
jgi:hypothetical protein